MKTLIKMLKDNSGASAAEYALILAIVGAGIVVAALSLQGAISNSMSCTAATINTSTDSC